MCPSTSPTDVRGAAKYVASNKTRVVTDPQIYDLQYSSRSFGKGSEIQSFSDPFANDWRYSSDHDHYHDPFTHFTAITSPKLELNFKIFYSIVLKNNLNK